MSDIIITFSQSNIDVADSGNSFDNKALINFKTVGFWGIRLSIVFAFLISQATESLKN